MVVLFLAGVPAAPAIGAPAEAPAGGKARHVVLMVWDGMRPDFVTPENTPVLYRMSREGVTFKAHHSAYPTSTEVNGAVLATGMYPGEDGVIGNAEFLPAVDPNKAVAMEKLDVVRKGDSTSGGKYLTAKTLAEMLHDAGKATAIAGTKGVALLHDRGESRPTGVAGPSPVVFEGKTIPESLLADLVKEQGPFPAEISVPNLEQNAWTVNALTKILWKETVPAYSVLWMSDPDYSQHSTGPGSKISLASIKSCDDYLGQVLEALEKKGIRDQTDVLVVSDHGFSTLESHFSLEEELNKAGIKAHHEITPESPADQIMVVALGGADLLYVPNHNPELTRKAADFLQRFEFTGVIFSRQKIEGTFSLDEGRINAPGPPDLVVTFRWQDRASATGVTGLISSDGRYKPGQGSHTTLSPYDLHNTLIATGPDFRAGFEDDTPSGNVDVAPTIAWILGVVPPKPMEGRVLKEALTGGNEANEPSVKHEVLRAAHDVRGGKWEQTLNISKVGGTVYFDEGKGSLIHSGTAK